MTREEQIRKEANRTSNNSDEFYAFMQGAEWVDENPKEGLVSIDKVCKWIEEHMNEFCMEPAEHAMISWLRKAMEE